MVQGHKVTKKVMQDLFPREVFDHVTALMKRYRTRNVKVYNEPAGWKMYAAEGASYTVFYRGERRDVRMMSEHNLHAGAPAASYAIGAQPELPVGAWLVEFELFLGKPFISVHNVGLAALAAG